MSSSNFAVLTVSDRCYGGIYEDKSGPALIERLQSLFPAFSPLQECVPDNVFHIQRVIKKWIDKGNVFLIVTTGGTGFSPRDITPEAVSPLIEKFAPAMTNAIASGSLTITPLSMLSRAVCGISKQSLIITVPGSKKGALECLEFIVPVLPHAMDSIRDDKSRISRTHAKLQGPNPTTEPQAQPIHVCPHRQPPDSENFVKADFEGKEKVTARFRQSPYPLVPVVDAIAIILKNSDPLTPELKNILLDQSTRGTVLCEDILAKHPVPNFPASIKDGYAVIADDGPGEYQVMGPSIAGSKTTFAVTPGHIARITTGAPVPKGADAVVQVEDTELIKETEDGLEELIVKINSKAVVGQDIRPIGFDIKQNEVVVEKGTVLNSCELGLAASVGATEVLVNRQVKVGILSTGNELLSPNEPLQEGRIRDSNKTMLLNLVESIGCQSVDLGVAKDTRNDLKNCLKTSLSKCDVIISTGGVSMGEKDLLKPVLQDELGATIHFGRVFMKPGKPTTFATLQEPEQEKKLIFSLPGNPVSAVVTFHLFVVPALKKLQGKNPNPTQIKAKIGVTLPLDPRPEYHRSIVKWDDNHNCFTASSTGSQCSSRLLSMKTANALLVLPEIKNDVRQLEKGTLVSALLIDQI